MYQLRTSNFLLENMYDREQKCNKKSHIFEKSAIHSTINLKI